MATAAENGELAIALSRLDNWSLEKDLFKVMTYHSLACVDAGLTQVAPCPKGLDMSGFNITDKNVLADNWYTREHREKAFVCPALRKTSSVGVGCTAKGRNDQFCLANYHAEANSAIVATTATFIEERLEGKLTGHNVFSAVAVES
jgi:hypothetical protein